VLRRYIFYSNKLNALALHADMASELEAIIGYEVYTTATNDERVKKFYTTLPILRCTES
jgi:rubrerythrin